MIFSAQRLRYFRVQKGDERKRPERFGDEDVRHFPEFAEIISQIVGSDVFCTAADKHFAWHLRSTTLRWAIKK